MEYAIAGLVLVGFVYFVVYKAVQKNERRSASGAGRVPKSPVQTEEK